MTPHRHISLLKGTLEGPLVSATPGSNPGALSFSLNLLATIRARALLNIDKARALPFRATRKSLVRSLFQLGQYSKLSLVCERVSSICGQNDKPSPLMEETVRGYNMTV